MSAYPTDLTDAEWLCLDSLLATPKTGGRTRIHSLRAVLDAVFYVLRSGYPLRLLPRDFPPWKTSTTTPASGVSTAEFTIILAEAASYHEELLRRSPDLLSEDILTQLQAGHLLPAATYLRAQRTRAVIQAAFRKAFDGHCLDGVLTPTVPCTAHLTEQTEQDMLDLSGTEEPAGQAYVRTTGPANLAGLPAIALPFKLSPEGLPISVQLLARPFQERELLRMAKALHDAAPCGLPWREPVGLGRALETR
jgi:Asp-tRNA(Asn)/Glu-tRNA(Gln) amidotransferase A subunit family amidase